jgi:hypothetical protein
MPDFVDRILYLTAERILVFCIVPDPYVVFLDPDPYVGFLNPDPLVKGPDPDPSIINQTSTVRGGRAFFLGRW